MDNRQADKLQRVLDYQLKLDTPADRADTERLIANDPEAQQLAAALHQGLKPLDTLADQTPPLGLADRTLTYIAQSQQARQLAQDSAALARRARHPIASSERTGRWVLGNLRDMIAVAACLMLLITVGRPGVQAAREVSNQQACASQLRQIGGAFDEYAADHNGLMPYVRHEPGATWWNVGNQGPENTSNTRHLFLLVKDGYLPAGVFRCPSRRTRLGSPLRRMTPERLALMRDFASRDDVTYSFRLMSANSDRRLYSHPRQVVMSDRNPVFAELGSRRNKEIDLTSHANLLGANSPNHRGIGQHILFPDGAVSFVRHPYVGPDGDDIFNIRYRDCYRGNEIPDDNGDIFIVP